MANKNKIDKRLRYVYLRAKLKALKETAVKLNKEKKTVKKEIKSKIRKEKQINYTLKQETVFKKVINVLVKIFMALLPTIITYIIVSSVFKYLIQ